MTGTKEAWVIKSGDDLYLAVGSRSNYYFFEWHPEFDRALKFNDYRSADAMWLAIYTLRPELLPTTMSYPEIRKTGTL